MNYLSVFYALEIEISVNVKDGYKQNALLIF